MKPQQFKINIGEENMLLDNPRACSFCDDPAISIIFERIPGTIDGAILSLKEIEGICIDHLTYNHMMIDTIR